MEENCKRENLLRLILKKKGNKFILFLERKKIHGKQQISYFYHLISIIFFFVSVRSTYCQYIPIE